MRRIKLLVLLLVIVCCASAENYEAYIQEQIDKSRGREGEVADKIDGLAKGAVLPSWRFGNPAAAALLVEESRGSVQEHVLQCNLADAPFTHGHSYAALHVPPVPTPGFCELHFRYVSGQKSGECWKCFEADFCPGNCFWLKADAVDYLYPTHKLNISEQMLLSRYLPSELVMAQIEFLVNYQKSVGRIVEVPANFKETLKLIGANTGEILPSSEYLSPALQAVQSLDAPTGSKGFYRHFPETYHAAIDSLPAHWFLPHEILFEPVFISDVQDFQTLFWLKNSNGIDGAAYQLFSMAPQVCVQANMGSGKTPDFPQRINPAWQPLNIISRPDTLQGMYCLKDVGEVFPYTALRRIHTSDGIFQTFVKGMKRYHDLFAGAIYTYRPDLDLLHLVRSNTVPALLNERLVADKSRGLRCDFLDQLSDLNTTYSTVNEIEPGLGAETMIEQFTRFRGCWGFKGAATMDFDFIVPMRPTRFPNPSQDRRVR